MQGYIANYIELLDEVKFWFLQLVWMQILSADNQKLIQLMHN